MQQANLNTFLAVAERLRVRGLCQSGGKSSPQPGNSKSGSPVPQSGGSGEYSSPASKRPRMATMGGENNSNSGATTVDVKEESQRSPVSGGGPGPGPPASTSSESASGSGGPGAEESGSKNRSRGGSEADLAEFGGFSAEMAAFDDPGQLQSALMAGKNNYSTVEEWMCDLVRVILRVFLNVFCRHEYVGEGNVGSSHSQR